MNLPAYTAKSALGKSKRTYYGRYQYGGSLLSGGTASVVPSQLEGIDVEEESSMMDEVGAEGMELEDMEGLSDEGEIDLTDETEVEDAGVEEAVGD